jgi:hypothetical protein
MLTAASGELPDLQMAREPVGEDGPLPEPRTAGRSSFSATATDTS